MEEIWKDIKGFEGIYQISSLAKIRNLRTNKILSPSLNNGYYRANLWVNNKAKSIYVHQLLAIAFIENPDNKPCVNHKDANKLNLSLSNLEWATYTENIRHAYANNLMNIRKGEDSPNAILTEKDVHEIRNKYKRWTYIGYKLAKEYGVEPTIIYNILNRQKWKHI